MKFRVTISFLLLLAMFIPPDARPQNPTASQNGRPAIDAQKEKLIRHLLELMHLNETMAKISGPMMTRMSTTIEAGLPGTEKYRKFSELVEQRWSDKLKTTDLGKFYVPIYDKYYTFDDIKALLAFYESPVGQKTLEVQANLSLDLVSAMTPAVLQLMKDADSEIRLEHPELAPDGGH